MPGECPATGQPCAVRSEEDLKTLGRAVVFETLQELGFVVEDKVESIADAREDQRFVRKLRVQAEQATGWVFKAVVTAAATFVIGALAIGIKMALK